jgi:hypothetical protein
MTRKSSPSADDGSAPSPPAALDDEGKILGSGRTVPLPPFGVVAAGVLPIVGTAFTTVDAAIDDEGFTKISRASGLKTTPLCLATATTTMPLTTLHAKVGGYDFFEFSEEEDSQTLLSTDQPEANMTHDEDPEVLLAAISASKHQHTLALRGKINKIGQLTSPLL